jgi:hypothetical protein
MPKIHYITIDVRKLKLFKGYVVMWAIKAYVIHYFTLNYYWFANIQFGYVIKTLLMPVLALYYSCVLVMTEFRTIFQSDTEIYGILSESKYYNPMQYAGI